MVDDAVRALRLAGFSLAATVLALGAHVLAGGSPPELLPTVAAVALPALAAVVLSRRRRTLTELVVVLGAVQLALHMIFAASPAGHLAGGHHHAHAGAVVGAESGRMLLMHGLAVLLTAALLAYGEQALHLLQTWFRSVPVIVRLLSVPVLATRRYPTAPVDRPVHELPTRWASVSVRRRGPPLPAC